MKSKEQILNEQIPLNIDGVNYITWEQAIEAMENYSKQLHKPDVVRPGNGVVDGVLLDNKAQIKSSCADCFDWKECFEFGCQK